MLGHYHAKGINASEVDNYNLRFRAFSGHSGPQNLTHSVTINTQSVDATYVYEGKNASPTIWQATVGLPLFISASGQVPTGTFAPFTDTINNRAIKFNTGQVYQCQDPDFGNTDTNDILIEAIVETTDSIFGGTYFGKYGTGPGYQLGGTTTSLRFNVIDSLGSNAECAVNMGNSRKWAIFHLFYDFDDLSGTGARFFINGVSTGASSHTSASTINNSNKLTIGGRGTFSDKIDGKVAYLAMYNKHNWFKGGSQNTTDWTNIALERANMIMGIYPQFASGSAKPTTQTRATVANLDTVVNEQTGERRLFPVHNGWMRLIKHREVSGSSYLTGYMAEPARSNRFMWSENFSKSEWIKGNLTITESLSSAPNGLTSGSALVAINDGVTHYMSQLVDFLTSTPHTFSVFAKAGNSSHITLALESLTTASIIASFDISNGTVANVISASGAGAAEQIGPYPYIENYGDGWYRCTISHQTAGGPGTFTASVFVSNDANNTPFNGSPGNISCYLYGAQVEAGNAGDANGAYATSYITTTNAQATRNSDDLRYNATFNLSSTGSSAVRVLSLHKMADSNPYIYKVGAANTDHILYLDGADYFNLLVRQGGSTQALIARSADTILDGRIHECRTYVAQDDFRLQTDQKVPLTDNSGQAPTIDTQTLYVGNSTVLTNQPGFIISDLRFYGARK